MRRFPSPHDVGFVARLTPAVDLSPDDGLVPATGRRAPRGDHLFEVHLPTARLGLLSQLEGFTRADLRLELNVIERTSEEAAPLLQLHQIVRETALCLCEDRLPKPLDGVDLFWSLTLR